MPTIDLRELSEPDEFALKIGGSFASLPAEDVARVISSFSEAYNSLGKQLSLSDFELHVVGFDEGSLVTVFRRVASTTGSLFEDLPKSVLVAVISGMIVGWLDEDFEKTEFEDYVEFRRGEERYLITKEDLDAGKAIPQPDKVGAPLSRVFDRLERIKDVVSVSLEPPPMRTGDPYFWVPRVDFARTRERAEAEEDRREERVVTEEKTRIQLIKAVFNDPKRKWEFTIYGKKESCRVADDDFFADTSVRKYLFGQGDELIVDLRILQKLDKKSGLWSNLEYEIERVHEFIPGGAFR